jgi:glycosyltransferase involved in cell wall biosynthesis
VRTFALTDYVQARAARQAAKRGIAEHDPRAIIYCSITAALLWPRPGAIFLDAIAADNRPGRHGVWQRPVERRRLRQAPLILAWSARAVPQPPPNLVVVPPAIPDEPPPSGPRDIAAVTYAGNPVKRRLELVLEAWRAARRESETLIVTGTEACEPEPGVEYAGELGADEFRGLLARARTFLAAPQREDFGIAPLEALACGCALVTTPAPGAYPALDLARRLDNRLVANELPAAIRLALDDPAPDYAQRAAGLLAPFRRRNVDQTVANHVLPRLLGA